MKFQKLRMPGRITAVLLAAVMGCSALTGCGKKGTADDSAAPTDSASSVTETETGTASSETDAAVTEAPTEPATEHISPTETVTSTLGTQIDVDVTLNRDNDNTYQTNLSQFVQAGDTIQSFTFVFYAGDGVSNIGTYKGGCGISVAADCAAATDEGWYQSEDFSVSANGSYVEVNWNVPGEIQSSVDVNGDILVGYWWGNTTTVKLSNVICTYTRTAQLPVDSTETISVGQNLNYGSDATNTVKVSLADVLEEGYTPQAITFDISAGSGFGKFTGGFGITTSDWYQSSTVAVLTDSTNLSLTWILPEDVKASVPASAEVMLGYWWGEPTDVTLQSITVKYSYGSGSAAAAPDSTPDDSTAETDANEGDNTNVNTGNASAIAADMKIGWNLGNTLDCYNVDWAVADHESAWGNPKTTKAMIDTVKAAGFNAVRVPVSWTDHITDDGTIDADWMARVHEVVDYVMDNDLYCILNMHHDDYTWLNPTYSDEAAVTEKYLYIWTQISEEFKNYDTKLLFEALNEPRVVGSAAEWMGGTSEEHEVINHLLQAFVDTVRASGGNNPERTLVVTTHAASITQTAVNGLVVPDDGNLIVSIHNYSPWQFTTLEYPDDKDFDENDQMALDNNFAYLRSEFIDKGIPVIIGEFGAEFKENDAERAEYYAYYISAAKAQGITCFAWDNGLQESFGLLDRNNCTWFNQSIIDGMMDAAG